MSSHRQKVFVLGLPHTQTLDPRTTPFLTCAFTNKVWTLCRMLHERGYHVVHLGTGGSAPLCSEQVDVVTREEWANTYGKRKPTDFYDISEDGARKAYVAKFAAAARRAILERCGPDWTSIVCITWGGCQWRAVDGLAQFVVETGVGYPNAAAEYRAYESYAWMNFHLGKDGNSGGDVWYWTVIPLAVDPSLYGPVTTLKRDYFLYLGRILDSKGVRVACQVARELRVPLKIVGQGDPKPYLEPGVTYQGPVGAEERRKLLREARLLLAPTRYVEPFGGVAVDAAMSGCPVITTDWGAFPETVLHGVTGYRCRTLDQFVWAARNIGRVDPRVCREWAEANFGLDRVALMYDEFFQMILDRRKDSLYPGSRRLRPAGESRLDHEGWYTRRPGRTELGWLEKYYPAAAGGPGRRSVADEVLETVAREEPLRPVGETTSSPPQDPEEEVTRGAGEDELPHAWTSDDRILVASRLLGMIQLDVSAGRYGEAGRPNVTSVLYVLQADAEVLEEHREELAAVLARK